jgi:hypothetical protein
VLLKDRDTFDDAVIAYIRGRARHKTPDLVGMAAAERTAQTARQAFPRKFGNPPHILIPDSPRQSTPAREIRLTARRQARSSWTCVCNDHEAGVASSSSL